MAKITLTVKNAGIKETQQFEIDRVTTLQMLKLKDEIGGIMKDLKSNGEIAQFMEILFNDAQLDPEDIANNPQAQMIEQMQDQRFVNGLAGAFDKLLEVVPERAFNLLSILSGIDRNILENVYFDEIFDVYDAIMSENDIVKMVERAKKSFFATKAPWGNLISKMFNKKEQAPVSVPAGIQATQTYSK